MWQKFSQIIQSTRPSHERPSEAGIDRPSGSPPDPLGTEGIQGHADDGRYRGFICPGDGDMALRSGADMRHYQEILSQLGNSSYHGGDQPAGDPPGPKSSNPAACSGTTGAAKVNFFSSLVAELKGPLGAIKQEELTVLAPTLGQSITAVLSNPTKEGLIAAAAPAVVHVAAAQPQIVAELLTDLVTAIAQVSANTAK